MMNYIAMQLASYFIIIWEVPKGAGKIGIINQDFRGRLAAPHRRTGSSCCPFWWSHVLTGHDVHLSAHTASTAMRSPWLARASRTASYAGIKVDRVIIRTMVLSGATVRPDGICS